MTITINYDNAALQAIEAPGGIGDRFVHDLARQAYGISQGLVPVDTGRLKASGAVERDGSAWQVVYHTDYSVYVEMGTRHQLPQPYLRPALMAVLP